MKTTFEKISLFGAGEPSVPNTFTLIGNHDDIQHFISQITTSHARYNEIVFDETAPVYKAVEGIANDERSIDTSDMKDYKY